MTSTAPRCCGCHEDPQPRRSGCSRPSPPHPAGAAARRRLGAHTPASLEGALLRHPSCEQPRSTAQTVPHATDRHRRPRLPRAAARLPAPALPGPADHPPGGRQPAAVAGRGRRRRRGPRGRVDVPAAREGAQRAARPAREPVLPVRRLGRRLGAGRRHRRGARAARRRSTPSSTTTAASPASTPTGTTTGRRWCGRARCCCGSTSSAGDRSRPAASRRSAPLTLDARHDGA